MRPDKSKRNLYKVTDRDLSSLESPEQLDRPIGLLINAICGLALAIWVIVNPRMEGAKLRNMKLAVRGFTLLVGTLLIATIYGIYLPLFKLGSVV